MNEQDAKPSTWAEAWRDTFDTWQRIRRGLDDPDEVWLLTEINAVCGLCEVARTEADRSGGGRKCEHCLFYEQFGGCSKVCAELGERIAAHQWQAARRMVDGFIADLNRLELPAS